MSLVFLDTKATGYPARHSKMAKRRFEIFAHILNSLFIAAFLAIYLNRAYPNVGHDFGYFIPTLLDSLIHYRVNGLTIQWYTPSFGGGLPSYPNPQQIQFSLPQVLTFFTNPWNACVISTILFGLCGYFATYAFLTRTLSLGWQAGVLGGLCFSLNGFTIEHMAVGHMGFQTFALLPVIALTVFSTSGPEILPAAILAGVLGIMVNAAGFFPIVIALLSLSILIPAIYLIHPEAFQFKRMIRIGLIGAVLTALLIGSKVLAVYAFMRFFPRIVSDVYAVNPLQGLLGIFVQLLGSMSLVPLFLIGHLNPDLLTGYMVNLTGAPYRYFEFDVSLSPVVILIATIGLYSRFRKPRRILALLDTRKKWIAAIVLLCFIWISVEFILAKGIIYPNLRELPILSSLHVNPRFTAVFIFPVILLAMLFYHRRASQYADKKAKIAFLLLNATILLFALIYFIMSDDFQERIYTVQGSMDAYRLINSGAALRITTISDTMGETQAINNQMSNLYPNEAIFGYGLENFHPEIKAGSIWDISGNYYNMTNPTGYVYPEINGTRPFERITLDEKRELEDFSFHKQPDWKIPLQQRIADWVSVLTALGIGCILLFALAKRLMESRRAHA